jgi:hypothetical protein
VLCRNLEDAFDYNDKRFRPLRPSVERLERWQFPSLSPAERDRRSHEVLKTHIE